MPRLIAVIAVLTAVMHAAPAADAPGIRGDGPGRELVAALIEWIAVRTDWAVEVVIVPAAELGRKLFGSQSDRKTHLTIRALYNPLGPTIYLPDGWAASGRSALLLTAVSPVAGDGGVAAVGACQRLNLPIQRMAPPPTQYREFCERHPDDCDMTGADVLEWTASTGRVLADVNRAVNADIRFMPDPEWQGYEEVWSYPLAGHGDCEDFALEKRRRLVDRGVSRASMTLAIVHHKTLFFPHVVLLAETTAGTMVLDNLRDELACWDAVPFNYETREHPDGRWIRFDQGTWSR